MKFKPLFHVLLISFTLLLVTLVSLGRVQQVSLAQGGGSIDLSKSLNRSTNVVRVGEVLSFTIALTNNSLFSLTQVTLIDNYNQGVMAFAGATLPPGGLNPATGVITWNVAPVLPNETITLTLAFTAEHPQTAVVNYARAEDLVWADSSIGQSAETSRTQDAIGGAAPIYKSLYPPDTIPQAGLLITFTHIITNDGAAMMTRLPLTDTYDPAFLVFHSAIPTPTIISQSAGLLVWADLTDDFGDLPPFSSIVVTTVFTAATQVVNTVNSASTEGAIDQYNNDLTIGATQVPITIIDDVPEAAPTPTRENHEEDEATPVATATPFPTQTPVAITNTTTGPLYLPETGWHPVYRFVVPILGLILLAVGLTIFRWYDRP